MLAVLVWRAAWCVRVYLLVVGRSVGAGRVERAALVRNAALPLSPRPGLCGIDVRVVCVAGPRVLEVVQSEHSQSGVRILLCGEEGKLRGHQHEQCGQRQQEGERSHRGESTRRTDRAHSDV